MNKIKNKFILILTVVVIFTSTVFSDEKPKNIILMIGDGMGTNYVTSSILILGRNTFERFPYSGFSLTSSENEKVTDSGAGATALATGYRTNNYMISVDSSEKPLGTILEAAMDKKKSVGVISTSSVTHATPAAFVSHSDARSKEFEIADQFIQKDLDVVIGGGTNYFLPLDYEGSRKDNLNLIDSLKNSGYKYFNNFAGLQEFDADSKFYALLDRDGIPPAAQRNYGLEDLTGKALNLLSQNKKGFFLMVEGSQIDWGGHDNNQKYILNELDDFCDAIEAALDFAEKDGNTLVIVTADHETGGMALLEDKNHPDSLKMSFNTNHHSASMVGVFSYGPGSQKFSGIIKNYEIGRKLFELFDTEKEW